jgi:FlaA1/EpsC-like NDP-sugar epimerase
MIGMAETILVTGATGNVGSEVTKQLSNYTSDLNLKAAVVQEMLT